MSRVAYVNGRFVPHRAAQVHIEDRGYQFADGVYEVVAVAGGRFVDLEPHLARLERSLAELKIATPMSRRALGMVMAEVVRRNGVDNGIIYLQLTRGVAPREPFDFATGTGRGAWVLAARYSILNLDDDAEDALVVPGTFTDQIQTGSVGLNWIPNAHAIVRTAVVGSFYEGDVRLDTGSGDREAALLVEFQLHF